MKTRQVAPMVYLLHLSDLHFVKNALSYSTEELLLREAAERLRDVPAGQKLLVLTGDFHNFRDPDYGRAVKFLKRLVSETGLEMEQDVFLIPGNHDVGNPAALRPLLEGVDPDWEEHLESDLEMLKRGKKRFLRGRLRAFRAYSAFAAELGCYPPDAGDRPASSHLRCWRGRLNLLHLNTALLADGSSKSDQGCDADGAAAPETWGAGESLPALALGHNSFFDLKQEQQGDLVPVFALHNVSAYLCGDRHKLETNPQQQMIRLEPGYGQGPEIPNLVAAKSIGDGDDSYSDLGFCWHLWDEASGEVQVEFRAWPRECLGYSQVRETGSYRMRGTEAPAGSAPGGPDPAGEAPGTPAQPPEELGAYLNRRLAELRKEHPSFKLMGKDPLDEKLFPGIGELRHFTLRGSRSGEAKLSPVWELIRQTWAAPENHSVVIEGEGGIGKTVTLLSVGDQPEGPPPVPALYVPMFDLVDGAGGCLDLTEYLTRRLPERRDAICRLAARPWQGPSLLLLLDGFNEVPAPQRLKLLELLRRWRLDHPGAQLIAVSRPLDGLRLADGLEEGAVSVRLAPLDRETVKACLLERDPERPLPPADSGLWSFLVYPLFLTLYRKADCLPQRGARDYPLDPRTGDKPGCVIWNYLQRELLRKKSEKWVLRCAAACEYLLPRAAYEMARSHRFTLGQGELLALLEQSAQALDPETLPGHLGALFDHYRSLHPGQWPAPTLFYKPETLLQELGLLTEYREPARPGRRAGRRREPRYAFLHQHFRDCLAGLHLMNLAEMAGEGEIPQPWRQLQSHALLDYAAQLGEPEAVGALWKSCRLSQQAEAPGCRRDDTLSCNLLELRERNPALLPAPSFAGMDLRGLSLARWLGGADPAPLFRDPADSAGTLLNRQSFSHNGHSGSVTVLAVLPDGRVASGSDDHDIRLWDPATGRCIRVLSGHSKPVTCLLALPDGRLLSGSANRRLRLWDPDTGACLRQLQGHRDSVRCLALLPDGRVLSGSNDGTLRRWDPDTGRCLQTLEGHRSWVRCVAILPDGRIISGSWDSTLRLWDPETGRCLRTLKGHDSGINCVAVLPEGRIVSGSNDCTLRLWDPETGCCLQSLKGHSNWISCVAVLPDGRIVSGSSDNTLRLWDPETGRCLQSLEGHGDWINCIGLLPDGRIVSGSYDSTLRIWDPETGRCLQSLEGHSDWINCIGLLPEGQIVSGSDDSTLRVWDPETGRCLKRLAGYNGAIRCLTALPEGRLACGAADRSLRAWDPEKGLCLKTLAGHGGEINGVAALPDGRIVSGSDDSTLRLWDPETGRCLQSLEGHSSWISCIAILPKGRIVSGSGDSTLRVWDPETGRCLQTLEGHSRMISCVAILPKGHIVSGSWDKTLRVWDPEMGCCLQTLEGHSRTISCVAVLPDGRIVSGSYDSTLRVWDPETGRCLQSLKGHSDWISCVAVLPDGRVVSGSDDSTLRVWDPDTGACLRTLKGHLDRVLCAAALPDGRILSGSQDKTLRIWDPNTGACLRTLEGHEGPVNCAAVLPDGRVASGSEDGSLRLWDPATGVCLGVLEAAELPVAGKDLSRAKLSPDLARLLYQNRARIPKTARRLWLRP